MKLEKLFENDVNKLIVNDIRNQCEFFLNSIGRDASLKLFRGIMSNRNAKKICDGIYFKPTRKDRTPSDTPKEVSKFIDDWMEENLGTKFRSQSVFCSGKHDAVMGYGKPVIILPTGKFEFCWSKNVKDLFSKYENLFTSDKLLDDKNEITPFGREKLTNILEQSEFIVSKQLAEAIKYSRKNGNEILIASEGYYIVDISVYELISRDLMKGNNQ